MQIFLRNEGEIVTLSISEIFIECVASIPILINVKGSSINSEEAIKEETLEHKREERSCKTKMWAEAVDEPFILSILNNVCSLTETL